MHGLSSGPLAGLQGGAEPELDTGLPRPAPPAGLHPVSASPCTGAGTSQSPGSQHAHPYANIATALWLQPRACSPARACQQPSPAQPLGSRCLPAPPATAVNPPVPPTPPSPPCSYVPFLRAPYYVWIGRIPQLETLMVESKVREGRGLSWQQ